MPSRKEAKKARRAKRKQHSWSRVPNRPYEESFPSASVENFAPGTFGPRDLVVFDPPGFEKMSEVLEDFAAPFMDGDHLTTDEELEGFFALAAAAWNVALLPAKEQQRAVDDLVIGSMAGQPTDAQAEFRSLFEAMVDRKKVHFAGNRRVISQVSVTRRGREMRINVVSSLPLPGQ